MKNNIQKQPIYSKLAELYDHIMSDVDYAYWAEYIDDLLHQHHPAPTTITELSCGTASLTLELSKLGDYTLQACDASQDMVRVGRKKLNALTSPISCFQASFNNLMAIRDQDALISVFDSINYLLQPGEIEHFFHEAAKCLTVNGLLIFDFSTPKNSIEAVQHLNEIEGDYHDLRYYRTSSFDPKQNIHTNSFEIIDRKLSDNQTWIEVHQQRAYELDQIKKLLNKSPLKPLAFYDAFSFNEARSTSTRITVVARCQKP
jgi:ubiquinone/menaquinone biosynthesis C-methylase UbiE